METGIEELVDQDKFTSHESPTYERAVPLYWQYFHIWFFRRNENRQKFKIAAKYIVLPIAVVGLFAGTIMIGTNERSCTKKYEVTTAKEEDGPHVKTFDTLQKNFCVYIKEGNEINCTDVDLVNGSDTLIAEIKDIFDNIGGLEVTGLRLNRAKFKNSRIDKGWLPLDEEEHPGISVITLNECVLTDVGVEAFTDIAKVERIRIYKSGITYLTISAFKGLKHMKELGLQENKDLIAVENGFLNAINLESFQLLGMDFFDEIWTDKLFDNLTESPSSVITVDLRYNYNMGTLRKSILKSFTNAVQIYLMGSGIRDFESEVFSSVKHTVRQIDLTSNNIETFDEEIFSDILDTVEIDLMVRDNPVRCNCNMKWIQNYFNYNNRSGHFSELTCASPDEKLNQNLLEADFDECDLNNPTTTSKTTTYGNFTTLTTTENSDGKECEIYERTTPFGTTIGSRFTVKEIYESGQHSLEITFKTNEDLVFMAFQDSTADALTCQDIDPQKGSALINNITENTDYLICFYGKDTQGLEKVSFYNCLAYKTEKASSDQPWITHGEKTLTIIYIICGVVGALLIGGLTTFCLVRRVPTLLKGSERVEIVKSRNGETVLIMPQRQECPPTPSSVYETISGYISNRGPTLYDKRNPPPLPPYPPGLSRCTDEHEYLEPRFLRRLPRNADLLLEYEWYTSQNNRPESSRSNRDTIQSGFYT